MRSRKRLLRAKSAPASREGNAPPPILLDELIIEILSWLPVKSLLRFRCVSKSWKSLISDPQFVKLHLHRSATNADFAHRRLILQRRQNFFFDDYAISCSLRSLRFLPSLPSLLDKEDINYRLRDKYRVFGSCNGSEEDVCYRLNENYWVIGSCNGLICFIGTIVDDYEECWVSLWNPATRLRSKKSAPYYADCPFGFTKYGFGHDLSSDTYKVVAIIFNPRAKEVSQCQRTQVKVYSMGDNCWRNIQCFPAVPTQGQEGIYLCGTLNWVAVPNLYWNSSVTIDQVVIVSLDLGKETYTQLLLPHGLDEVLHVGPTLGILKDCLCFSHDDKRTHFVVWQMKEFGVDKSWTQLVKVSYEYLQTGCLESHSTLFPLCMNENGDVLMLSDSGAKSQAILYNQRDNRLERFEIPEDIYCCSAKDYVQSLISPC